MVGRGSEERRAGRGVSTVIGVVLLVSVTVLLAAVVAVFVTGFGGTQPEPAPTFADATLFDDRLSGNGQYLNVSHDGGSELSADDVQLDVQNAKVVDSTGSVVGDASVAPGAFASRVGSTFVAGETLVVDRRAFVDAGGDPLTSSEFVDLTDATVRLVYYQGGEGRSAVVYECEIGSPDCVHK